MAASQVPSKAELLAAARDALTRAGLSGEMADIVAERLSTSDDPRARLKLFAAMFDRAAGYRTAKRLVKEYPDDPSHWMVLAIMAGQMGYSKKRREALDRCIVLAQELSDGAHVDAATRLLSESPSGPMDWAHEEVLSVCSVCGRGADFELPTTSGALCRACLGALVALVESRSWDDLCKLWKLSAEAGSRRDEVAQLWQMAGSMGLGPASYEGFASAFLEMGDGDGAFLLLIEVIRRHVSGPARELDRIVELLFDERLTDAELFDALTVQLREVAGM